MNINIKATNIELTPAIKSYIDEKVGSLKKYIGGNADISIPTGKEIIQAWVEVGMTSKHHQSGEIFRAEIQIRLPNIEKKQGSTLCGRRN